jgi:hypothetical protein
MTSSGQIVWLKDDLEDHLELLRCRHLTIFEVSWGFEIRERTQDSQ